MSKSIERQLGGLRGIGKSVGDSITKDVKTAGADAGDALAEGIGKGAKDAGKSVSDELTKSTKSVGAEAGKQVGDALNKGVAQGAKDAGQALGDEIGKATQKAADDASKIKVEPKVTPKVDTKATKKEAQSIPQIIYGEANKAAKSNGYDSIEDVLVEGMDKAGKKAGQVLGSTIGDAIHDHLGLDLSNTFSDVDFASVLNNTLDRGLKASADDLATGLAKRLGTQIGTKAGSAIQSSVEDLTGLNLGSLGIDGGQLGAGAPQAVLDFLKGGGIGSTITGGKDALQRIRAGGLKNIGRPDLSNVDLRGALGTVNDLTGGGAQPILDAHDTVKDVAAGLLGGTTAEKFLPAIADAALPIIVGGAGGKWLSDKIEHSNIFDNRSRIESGYDDTGTATNPIERFVESIPYVGDFLGPSQEIRTANKRRADAAVGGYQNFYESIFGNDTSGTGQGTSGGGGSVSTRDMQVEASIATIVASSVSLGNGASASLPSLPPAGSRAVAPSSIGSAGSTAPSEASLYGSDDGSMLVGRYAGGGLRGDATIQAPVGPSGLIQWAEPSTKGEAFIPLGGGERSKAIWLETGKRLGVITAFEKGGLGDAGGLLPFSQQLRQYVMAALPRAIDLATADQTAADQNSDASAAPPPSSGGGSGAELPSSFSAAAAMPLSQLGSTITGITGETSGGHSPGDFVTAAGEGVAGQVQSALGVFGVNDSPGWLQAASQLIGGIKVGDGKGNTLFDGSNLFGGFGSFGGAGRSAMPISAASHFGAAMPPDDGENVHGARAGQAPGPVYNIRTATVEDAFLQAQRREKERAAAKLGPYA